MRQTSGTIHIKWVRSTIGLPRRQKQIVASLGLRRLNQVVERPDTPNIRGIVAKVPHLLQVVAAPVSPLWAAVPEYVIVAPEALPKPQDVSPKRVEQPVQGTAVETPRAEAIAAVEGAASPEEAGTAKERVSASAEQPAAKSETERPRRAQEAEGEESKLPKKGKK